MTIEVHPPGIRTRLYSREELFRLVHPGSIAIVGASPRQGSFGSRANGNLNAFEGDIYLVNSRYDEIAGRACYPSLGALPIVPDCVLLMVAATAVEDLVRECVDLGVGGVIIHASGFAEIGKPEMIETQARIVAIAEKSATRVFGPNSLGIGNYLNGARMTFGRLPEMRPHWRPSLGLVCQSGAIAMALSQAMERGVAFDHVFMLGNAADVDLADCISYLVDDPKCDTIACVLEGTASPARLVAAADAAFDAGKPLVIYKMADSEQGAAAAMSHTGMLAGSNLAFRAAFDRAGAVMVDSLEEVIETAQFFAKASKPTAAGVGVIVTSGGAGVMAADKAALYDVSLPQPRPETLHVLERVVPEFGSPRNPCDVTAQVLNDEDSFEVSAEAMIADSGYGALIVAHLYADAISTRRLAVWSRLAKKFGKIVCNYWATEWLEGPGAYEAARADGVAMFRSLDRCMKTLSLWHRQQVLTDLRASGRQIDIGVEVRKRAREELSGPSRVRAEREAKRLLASYGVPVVEDRLTRTVVEAVEAARQVGWPVVLKIDSDAIAHKTDAGVVALDIADAEALEQSFERIKSNAARVASADQINGVLVQPMVPSGVEILVGGKVDPSFGPFVVVGFGGVMAELLKDIVMIPAPASPEVIKLELARLKGAALLNGFRGSDPVNRDRLSEVVARISEFIADNAGVVRELDVNPLICSGDCVVAVDALIVT